MAMELLALRAASVVEAAAAPVMGTLRLRGLSTSVREFGRYTSCWSRYRVRHISGLIEGRLDKGRISFHCVPIRSHSAVATELQVEVKNADKDYSFLADESVTWGSLGLSDEISKRVLDAGFERPSAIQAAAVPLVLGGGDVVVAAETGSGKTHAYLVPLCHEMARLRAENEEGRSHQFALILCPNATLCKQVENMAASIKLKDPLKVVVICGGQGWPLTPPDVVIATPGAVTNSLFAADPKKRRRTAFVRDVRIVVLDEADMLLCGGSEREVTRLLTMFKLEERRISKEIRKSEADNKTQESQESQKSQKSETKKKNLLDDALTNSSDAIPKQPWTDFPQIEGEDIEDEVTSEWVDALEDEEISESEAESENSGEELAERVDDDTENVAESENVEDLDTEDAADEVSGFVANDVKDDSTPPTKKKKRRPCSAARRAWNYLRSKQYVFVAATLPESGKKTPGALIAKQFPKASWANGTYLHCHNPRVEHRWVEVNSSTRIEALLRAIKDSPRSKESVRRVMVFANTVDAVDAIAKILSKAGIGSMIYHRCVEPERRTASLKKFQKDGGILMCTDSAARGLDIPDVGHIIQAEFALSAVDFLHRVGRTGRAGNEGLVTSFYVEASKPLVEAVQKAVFAGKAVEEAFSRKRSFRNKLKKRLAASSTTTK